MLETLAGFAAVLFFWCAVGSPSNKSLLALFLVFMIDEKRLEDQGTRAEFLERVFAYQQRRDSPSAPTRGV